MNTTLSRSRSARGFTLMELLVTISIVGTVFAGAYGVFAGGLDLRTEIWSRIAPTVGSGTIVVTLNNTAVDDEVIDKLSLEDRVTMANLDEGQISIINQLLTVYIEGKLKELSSKLQLDGN